MQKVSGVGGVEITRLTPTDDGKPLFFIDAIQRGNVVYMTFSQKTADLLVPALAGLPPQGKMSELMDGSVDLGPLFNAIVEIPAAAENLPEDQRASLRALPTAEG